jgi:alanine dehydrogenase
MTLFLSDEEVRELLTVEMCLENLEQAYRELGQGLAISSPRCDVITANPESSNQEPCHGLKTMTGSVSGFNVGAIRINSDVLTWPSSSHGVKRVKVPRAPGHRYTGLVLLFSLETGELLALFPDASIQRMRVGTTSALGAKYLARKEASSLGLYGSGWQAGSHLMAFTRVRPVREIKVYSPTRDRCEAFCKEMEPFAKCAVLPMKNPEEVMKDADMVMAATNSLEHVIRGKWVEKGMYLCSVKPGEIDQEAYDRCDLIVMHTHQLEPNHYLANGGRPDPPGFVKERASFLPAGFKGIEWRRLPLLSDVVLGREPARTSEDQIICFSNNLGIGVQFAAVGQAIYRKAKEEGKGKELPTEWFSQLNHP